VFVSRHLDLALGLAVIVLLAVDPFLLHSVAFLLSCSAVWHALLSGRSPVSRLRDPLSVWRGPGRCDAVLLTAFRTVPVVTPFANLAAPAARPSAPTE
jgi:predicted membrane metal-binding protein